MTKLIDVSDTMENSPHNPFTALAGEAPHTVTRKAAGVVRNEPTMAGLRRVLGDGVLAIFPQELMDAVDRAYVIWKENPDVYLPTPFDTEQDRADSLTVMRAYAECAPKGPYTIRTLSDPNPLLLIWRAQNRRMVRGE